MVKDRAAAFKKTIGEDVDPEKLREPIWNAMDPGSKMMATQMGVHRGDYDAMTKFIDERYRVTFGHVEYHSPKDDPMGIFAMGARPRACWNDTDRTHARAPAAAYRS